MALPLHEEAHLRDAIVSQCIWSDTYSSLKHILKRTADQLPILVTFPESPDQDVSNDNIGQTILFFDRNVSKKILFTPLRQLDEPQDQFEVYPRHCTFAITDVFKGAIEFVNDGKRSTRIFKNLEDLVEFSTNHNCSAIFMSRDRIHGYYSDINSSKWQTKDYPQGAIFHAQRIHRSSGSSHHKHKRDYLECLDEESELIYLKMTHHGRYSLIATSTHQQDDHPEIYLHSTQTANISELIQRLTPENTKNNNCIRLVRGSVPHNFLCQYLQLVRQRTYDVLVGITQENLIVEWNLDSHTPCRYATNLNDILNKLSGSYEEQILESYIDQARTHYREEFQVSMQLLSTIDWAAFFQYWKWTGDIQSIDKSLSSHSRQTFHLIASIQDLSDEAEILCSEFKKTTNQNSPVLDEIPRRRKHEKILTTKQHLFLSEMSKLLSTPSTRRQKKHRTSLQNPRASSVLITPTETLFDDSIYDSNQKRQSTTNITRVKSNKQNARRSQ